jgi:hypothetical protein
VNKFSIARTAPSPSNTAPKAQRRQDDPHEHAGDASVLRTDILEHLRVIRPLRRLPPSKAASAPMAELSTSEVQPIDEQAPSSGRRR